ncbi:hypothetical protein [Aeromicrobium massiliense]|uniref:hypothetical protein n=1 Tax=Aeromicrobium massiliense TaxID=1464554 RepID=UPI0002FC0AC9|nr:hypothetical protein [Aeromicrobium massiliense]
MKRITKAAALAATSIIALAPAAMAATYTVAVGGNTTVGTNAYTASTGGITFDTNYGVPMTCSSGTAAGNIQRGATFTPPTASTVATITGTTWSGCIAPTLFNTQLNVTQVGTWNLKADSAPVGGVVSGEITNVSAQVRSVVNDLCEFDVTGTVDGSFDTNNQTLSIDGGYGLTISNVVGCFGEVLDDDTATFGADYAVSTTGGSVTFR